MPSLPHKSTSMIVSFVSLLLLLVIWNLDGRWAVGGGEWAGDMWRKWGINLGDDLISAAQRISCTFTAKWLLNGAAFFAKQCLVISL